MPPKGTFCEGNKKKEEEKSIEGMLFLPNRLEMNVVQAKWNMPRKLHLHCLMNFINDVPLIPEDRNVSSRTV